MDEPFSALDVLTGETLRTDFLDLWVGDQLPTKAVLMVTHNIEEAVLMCDRILVLGANPGHIAAEIKVPLKQPRNRFDGAFHAIVDEIYSILTSRITEAIGEQSRIHGGLVQELPEVTAIRLCGFAEAIAAPPFDSRAELSKIARSLALGVNDLLPIAAGLHLLEFAELKGNSIKLTAAGRVLARSGTEDRKRLFREHLLRFVPLAAHIRQVLDGRDDHNAPRARFEYELEDHLPHREAEKTLQAAIEWARYAELFAYDDRTRKFSLDNIAAECRGL
jgi:NitT/TauT family transport system ATP-binding protein